MKMKLSSNKEQLVLENQALIHYLVRKLGIYPSSVDYEDIVSEGKIGLIKAAITFDESKNITFATYARKCITNEIYLYFRKNKKYANNISLNETLHSNEKDAEQTLNDLIADPSEDFIEEILQKESFKIIISIVLNCFKPRDRLIMLYYIAGVKQNSIAKMLNMDQGHLSRSETRLKNKLKELYFSTQEQYMKLYLVEIVGNLYQISFVPEDINQFNKSFSTFLQSLVSTTPMPNFKVMYGKERIVIQVPVHQKSLYLIAKIIQEIDNFSIVPISDKNTSHTTS